MAKDPAFLFYSKDWVEGTAILNFDERGKYIHLLAIMHQQGRLDEETISFLVGSVSVKLKSKFKVDEKGLWYNEKLENEIEKRIKFTESRVANGKKGGRPRNDEKPLGYASGKPSAKATDNLVANANEIENKDELKSKNGIWPGTDDLGMDIPTLKVGSVIQLISAAQQITLTTDQVKLMWEAFKAQHFTSEKYYKSINDIYSHFINWSKQQKIKDGKSVAKTTSGRSAGTVSYLEKLAARHAAGSSGDNSG